MTKLQQLLLVFFTATVFSSCTTDFDLIAPYEDRTIVYGLLDQSSTIHYIKVNKAFLGDGNAYDYAVIKDSSEYSSVTGTVEEWNGNTLMQTFTLRDTTILNRDSGVFYYPEQTLYYFTGTINDNYEYRLKLLLKEGTKEVNASTTLVRTFDFLAPTNTPLPMNFANSTSGITGQYPDVRIKYITSDGGRQYDMWLHFIYEEYTATDTTRKNIIWKLNSFESNTVVGGQTVEVLVNGKQLYNVIANRIQSNTNVVKRVFRQIDVQVVAANDDLYTYMKVNAPSTGINQERPSFTNLSNAIGIFASRYTRLYRGKVLTLEAHKELCEGPITGHLLFCTDSGVFASQSFYCP